MSDDRKDWAAIDGLDPERWTPVDAPIPQPRVPAPPVPQFSGPTFSASLPPQLQYQPTLVREQYNGRVPVIPTWPQPAAANANVNSATSSATADTAATAQTAAETATNAASQAAGAATTATAAQTGVTTINSKTAVALVSGTLKQVAISTLGNTIATPTLDNLNDGSTYNRVLATALTSGAVDSTKAGFLATTGSTVPQIVGSTAALFSYTSTTTTITISWSSFTVYFANNTTATVSSGSQTITGLTASTTYYFYAYLPASNVVTFAAVSGGHGTPAILYTPQSPLAAQAINLQSVTALSNGGVAATTPASGSGGGSGGGSGLCVRSTMLVQSRDRGVIPVGDLVSGDFILGRDGFTEVVAHKVVPQNQFIRFTTTSGSVEITPTHHNTTSDGRSVDAARVSLLDILIARNGYAAIKRIELVEVDAHKVVLTCEPEHTFFAGEESPSILVSNAVPIS